MTIGGGKTGALFKDGAELASTMNPLSWPDSDAVFWIGVGYTEGWNGEAVFSNLKWWNYAKTNYSDRFIEGFGAVGKPGANKLNRIEGIAA
jgi:hypothetical protein